MTPRPINRLDHAVSSPATIRIQCYLQMVSCCRLAPLLSPVTVREALLLVVLLPIPVWHPPWPWAWGSTGGTAGYGFYRPGVVLAAAVDLPHIARRGRLSRGGRRVSLGVSEEGPMDELNDPMDELNATARDDPSDGHHYQPMFGYQPLGDQMATQALVDLGRGSPSVSQFPAASRSRADISETSRPPARDSPPPPRSRLLPSPLPGPDPDRGWLGPLHLAASRGHDRIVRMLLKRHRSVNEPDSDGLTALMHAVQGGFENVTRSLLDAGAAVDDARRARAYGDALGGAEAARDAAPATARARRRRRGELGRVRRSRSDAATLCHRRGLRGRRAGAAGVRCGFEVQGRKSS